MKKKLLFGMAAVSILAVGLLSWSCDCGDDETPSPPSLSISLSGPSTSISVGRVMDITATVTRGGSASEGEEVSFSVTKVPAGSLAKVSPATDTTDANGEAVTTLSAGTVIGNVVVEGAVGVESATIAVTITAGTVAGIAAINGDNQYLCGDSMDITVQLVDAFGNAVTEPAEEMVVSFSVTPETIAEGPGTMSIGPGTSMGPVTVLTDGGQAVTILSTTDLTPGDTLIVTSGLTFDEGPFTIGITVTRREDAVISTFDSPEPAYRAVTLAMHADLVRCEDIACSNCIGDHTCNAMGGPVIGSFVNPELQGAVDGGDANIIFIYRGLTVGNWADAIVDTGVVGGKCGYPDAPADCAGGEIKFYVDETYYNTDTGELNLVYCGLQVTNGASELALGGLTLPFPAEDEEGNPITINLELCNLYGKMTVAEGLETAGGELSGAIPEVNLEELVNTMLPGMWEIAKGMIGEPDTECDGEPAYSVRLLFTSNAVDVFEYNP